MCPDRKFSIPLQFEVEKLSWLWLVVRTRKPTGQWAVVGVFFFSSFSIFSEMTKTTKINWSKEGNPNCPTGTHIHHNLANTICKNFFGLGKASHFIKYWYACVICMKNRWVAKLKNRYISWYISVNSNNKNHETELCQHFEDYSRNSVRQQIISSITVCFLVAHEFCIVYFFFKIITFYN